MGCDMKKICEGQTSGIEKEKGGKMAQRMIEMAERVINSNTFVNICLVGCFSVLGLRSHHQQNLIESLEAQNSQINNTNKAIKKTIWNSKHQLYSQATADAVVPLSRLQSIYGDFVASASSGGVSETSEEPSEEAIIV